MERKIKILSGSLAGITASIVAGTGRIFAAANGLNPPDKFNNLMNIDLNSAVSGIIKLLLIISFVVAFLFLIFGGIRWILSGGDKSATESARGTLTAALIGLVIVLAAWLIITLIQTAFGINILDNPIEIPNLYNIK